MMNATPDQAKERMEAWVAWAASVGGALIEGGSHLARVAQLGTGVDDATDDSVTGYSVLEADRVQTVTDLLSNHPHLRLGSISVLEARFQYHSGR
jgi:hypothetical protein